MYVVTLVRMLLLCCVSIVLHTVSCLVSGVVIGHSFPRISEQLKTKEPSYVSCTYLYIRVVVLTLLNTKF